MRVTKFTSCVTLSRNVHMLPFVRATISTVFLKYSWHLHHTFTHFQTKTAVSLFQTVFSYFDSMNNRKPTLSCKVFGKKINRILYMEYKRRVSPILQKKRVIFMNPQYLLIGARKTVRISNWLFLSLQLSTILLNSSKT